MAVPCAPNATHWGLQLKCELLTLAVMIEFLVNMSASADVLAMAKAEVDLNTIPEGKNVSLFN